MTDEGPFRSGNGLEEIRSGWRILVACSVGVGLGMAALFLFTSGVMAVALHQQFGWSRGAILGAASFDMLAAILIGPWVGQTIDRFGARTVALVSIFGIGAGTMALSLTGANIWTYYALYGLRAAVSVGTLPPTFAKVVVGHFDKRRGLGLGIVLCTTGVGGIVLPPLTQLLVAHFGWRMAFVGLGLLPLLIAMPLVWWLLPDDRGTADVSPTASAIVLPGFTVREALGKWRFWLVAGVSGAAGAGLGGILFNLVPMLVDRGFSPATAAAEMSLYGLTIVIGRLLSGYLLDHLRAPLVGFGFFLLPTAGALLLAGGVHTTLLISAAVFLLAMASGGEFDLVAYVTRRYFGQRNFSTLYAILYAFFGLGAGGAPGLYGHVHDATGGYGPALLISAGLFAACAVAILTLGPYPVLENETR